MMFFERFTHFLSENGFGRRSGLWWNKTAMFGPANAREEAAKLAALGNG
jgi:hypothetical protein